MPGQVTRVISKQVFPCALSQTVIIARAVDISQWREATLIVRLHTGTALGSGSQLNVTVYPDAPTNEDGYDFYNTSALVSSSNIISTTTVPSVLALMTIGSQNLPAFIRVHLVWGASGSGQVVLSADLVTKS